MQTREKTTLDLRVVLWTSGLTFVSTGILNAVPGASLPQLADNTHVTLAVAGSIFIVGALGFLLSALLAGNLVNLIKPKYLLITGLSLQSLGSLLTPLSDSFPLLLIGQGLKGCGGGLINISVNTIATHTFREDLSEKLSTIHDMFGLGALSGPLILAAGLQLFNNLSIAYVAGIIVSLISLLLALRQPGQNMSERARAYALAEKAAAPPLRKILLQGLLWLMVLQIGLYASAEIGFGNWIVTIVSQSAGINLALAAPVATAFYIGLTTGRLGGARLLRHARIDETRLLYIAVYGGAVAGALIALFPGQLLISFGASALMGCFYGPLFPCIMSITSRRFKHAVGPVSSIMMIGNGITTMIVPAAMGTLIPMLGINWVISIPALLCLSIAFPMALANRATAQVTSARAIVGHEIEASGVL